MAPIASLGLEAPVLSPSVESNKAGVPGALGYVQVGLAGSRITPCLPLSSGGRAFRVREGCWVL